MGQLQKSLSKNQYGIETGPSKQTGQWNQNSNLLMQVDSLQEYSKHHLGTGCIDPHQSLLMAKAHENPWYASC